MAGKVFVNYRRDDARDMAARVRDRLAATFGTANVFMDVDNLLAGQRFDRELEKALGQTDVFLAVIGQRWMELLAERQASGERDYVREEIAVALQRQIVVVPVVIERTPLPRADALPDDIRDLVLHQKHLVTHERFGRDVEDLVEAIRIARKAGRGETGGGGSAVRWAGAVALVALLLGGGALAYQWAASDQSVARKRQEDQATKAKAEAERARQDEIKRAAEAAPAKKKADEEARAKAAEAERQRLAMLQLPQEEGRGAEAEAAKPGRTFRDCPDCPEMVVVPAGSFMMGSPAGEEGRNGDEGPQRQVRIARPFAVGKYEVTFAEWDACVSGGGCKHNPRDKGWGRGKRPVINVSRDDITKEYLPWLSRKTGKSYRLLTEAEWEYAARSVTSASSPGKRYWWGDQVSHDYANYGKDQCCGGHMEGKDQWEYTAPVGQFPANPFGLYDMHGNVWEWLLDCYKDSYAGSPTDGSAVSDVQGCYRVLRGGSWSGDPRNLRSAHRNGFHPGNRYDHSGFRLARTL